MNVPIYQGISQIINNYDAFIIGIRGVIVGKDLEISKAKNVLEILRANNKKVILLTNSSCRTAFLKNALEAQGISKDLFLGILSAGELLHFEFKNKTNPLFNSLGNKYFLLGQDKDENVFENLPFDRVNDINSADFIFVCGASDEFPDADAYVSLFNHAVSLNLPMISCGYDRISILGGKIVLGAGAIASQYQKLGGNVIFRGKPDVDVFEYCCEGFDNLSKEKIAVIGDSFDTDILGASNSGLDSFLIISGIHYRELGAGFNSLFPDAERINDLARINGVFPKGAMEYFSA